MARRKIRNLDRDTNKVATKIAREAAKQAEKEAFQALPKEEQLRRPAAQRVIETVPLFTFASLLQLEKDKDKRLHSSVMDKVRQFLKEGNRFDEWWDYTYDMWKEALEQIGFEKPDIRFSGFCSQGDGASFSCDYVNPEKLVGFLSTPTEPASSISSSPRTGSKEDFWPWLVYKAKGVSFDTNFKWLAVVDQDGDSYIGSLRVERRSTHYSHERTCNFDGELSDAVPENATIPDSSLTYDDLFKSFCEAAEQLRLDLSKAIYRDLEQEDEYLDSDESLENGSDAFLFDLEGEEYAADEYK